MYVREQAMADAELVVEGLEGLVAQAKQLVDESNFDEEPRAFLSAARCENRGGQVAQPICAPVGETGRTP
jgi:hypothetical protein